MDEHGSETVTHARRARTRCVLAVAASFVLAAPAIADSLRVSLVRTLPVDSGRVDVAAHVLPVAGGALVAGWTSAPGQPPDALLLRVNESGAVIWRRHHGGPNTDLAFSVQPDGGGGYVCAGFVAGRGAGGSDGWIFAVDSAGAMVWERLYGGPEDERLTSLQRSGEGWIAAGQTSRGGNVDAWAVRTDSAGNDRSTATWGGSGIERGLGVAALDDGGAVIVGAMSDSSDPGDAFAVRLDRAGRARWAHRLREPGRQVAYHLRATAEGFLVTGYGFADSARDYDGRVTLLDRNGRERRRVDLGGTTVDRAVQSVRLADGTTITIGYSRPRASADDRPVWTTMLYATDRLGRTTWSRPVGEPGRESGRWIAGSRGEYWAVGQSATPDGGSAVLVIRLAAGDIPAGGARAAPGRSPPAN